MREERPPAVFLPESDRGRALLVALLASAVFGNTLAGGFLRDDFRLLADDRLLRGWAGLRQLLAGGGWAAGAAEPGSSAGPLALLSYFLSAQLLSPAPWAHHLASVALYAADCALVYLVGRRFCARASALAAACLFAVLPVHCGVVAYLSARAELLCLGLLLLSWRELGRRRPAPWPGFLYYALALASGGPAALFPAALALQDWVFLRRRFWRAPRRGVHLGAAALALAWVLLGSRLSRGEAGGAGDYFAGASFAVRALTLARFAFVHYALPSLSGLGLRSDYSRPFFPDSGPGDLLSWAAMALGAALLAWAASRAARARSRAAFWVLFVFLFWLPAAASLPSAGVLGSERVLFLPTLGFAFLLAMAAARLPGPARALCVLLLVGWYGTLSALRNAAWRDERSHYADAARRNPHSRSLAAYGASLLEKGKEAEGMEVLEEAARLGPTLAEPPFQLGRVRLERGDLAAARAFLSRAVELAPEESGPRLALARVEEKEGRLEAAARQLEKALATRPEDPAVKYAFARALLRLGRPGHEALLAEFLRLWPKDELSGAARKALARGRSAGGG